MSAFKINIDEDLLLIRSKPGLLNYLIFFRHWSYNLELPTNRIVRLEVERRAGILTLIVVKSSKDGINKNIAVSLLRANKKQVNFIKNALPTIISEKPPMHDISKFIKVYLE